MRATVLTAVTLLATAACPGFWCVAASLPSTQFDALEASLEASRRQQRNVERLDDERRRLTETVTGIVDTGDAYAAQNAQLRAALEALEAERAQLGSQLAQAGQTRQEIMPLLREITDGLAQFIATDTPFDLPRRRARLAEAQRDLEAPDLPLASRYRSVMSAWRDELDYAFRLRVARERLALPGGMVLADTLQVGRAAFYYVLPDGSAAGLWNSAARRWEELPDDQRSALRAAMLAARDGSAGAVLQLPVAAP